MLEKYRATIHGETISWDGDIPDEVTKDGIMEVYVTRVGETINTVPNGQRAMAALERIAEKGGIQSIVDPVAWQREIRKDRPLPGRE
ncbi:MAG: hypothetical protein H0X08_05020 [Blastocatellia bacterium]|jgi:hypothetical protein|nr:hypothetical protein [Blastocatellia bacterium]